MNSWQWNTDPTAITCSGSYFSSTPTISIKSLNAAPPPPHTRTPPLGFNRYVNASDLLEEFIAFLGEQSVRQGEVMGLPLELFVKWLVIRACEEDCEESGVELALPGPPRCVGCGRWIRRGVLLSVCRPECAAIALARNATSEGLARAATDA